MAGPEHEYDDTGASSSVFVASLLALYLIPATYSRFKLLLAFFLKKDSAESNEEGTTRAPPFFAMVTRATW